MLSFIIVFNSMPVAVSLPVADLRLRLCSCFCFARACERAGYPKVAFNVERGRMELRDSPGQPVSKTADKDFEPIHCQRL